MRKRNWFIVGAAAVALVGLGVATRGVWLPERAAAQKGPAQRVVPVEVAKAERKAVPVRLEALGTVTPIASVVLKPRVDSVITGVHFADGAMVKEGDVLFTLDSRSIEAQIKQVEGVLKGARAQLDQAERDVQRYTDLFAKNATSEVTLNNAKTQVNIWGSTVDSNTAQLENLQVQLSYCTIRAPISGKISAATVKVGNFVRAGSDTVQLATINQMAPVYVTFTVPQKELPDLRKALAAQTATVEATIPGEQKRVGGRVTMIENTVDPSTGMATVRATMPNEDGALWPGTLVSTEMTLRVEEAVVVPSNAVQVSQTGNFVFVVADGVAKVQPVKIERTVGTLSVVASGLAGGESVVTEGQLLLSNGTRVNARAANVAGS